MSFPLAGATHCNIRRAIPTTQNLTPNLGGYWRELRVLRKIDPLDEMSEPAIRAAFRAFRLPRAAAQPSGHAARSVARPGA